MPNNDAGCSEVESKKVLCDNELQALVQANCQTLEQWLDMAHDDGTGPMAGIDDDQERRAIFDQWAERVGEACEKLRVGLGSLASLNESIQR